MNGQVLWEVDDVTGAAKFGDSYKSANYLLEFHFYNAAWQTGDHIHEGLGFVPQHMKLTNIFENSLRAVNPAVTLPFWDFTVDTAAGLSVWDSFAFQVRLRSSRIQVLILVSHHIYILFAFLIY